MYSLNESLLSSILYNDILNEPGGFFKYHLPKYIFDNQHIKHVLKNIHHPLYLAIKEIESMYSITLLVFNLDHIPMLAYTIDMVKEKNPNLTKERLLRLNTNYNKHARLYTKYMLLIFKRPSPDVFNDVIHTGYVDTTDIFNITDRNFKKYTYTELSKNKDLYLTLTKNEVNTIFWFSNNKELQAISIRNQLIHFGINITNKYTDNSENLLHLVERKYTDPVMFFKEILRVDILDDGTKLEWPILSLNVYDIKKYTNMFKRIFTLNAILNKTTCVVGNPFVKSSNIRTLTKWDKDGYIIVYTPTLLDTPTQNIAAQRVGNEFNYHHSQKRIKLRADYRCTYDFNKYKWIIDEEDKIIPYSLSGKYYQYDIEPSTGKILVNDITSQITNSTTYGDIYAQKIQQANQERYKDIKELNMVKTKEYVYTLLKNTIVNKKMPEILNIMDIFQLYVKSHDDYNLVLILTRLLTPLNKMIKISEFINYVYYLLLQVANNVITDKETKHAIIKNFRNSYNEYNALYYSFKEQLKKLNINQYINA